MKSYVLRLVRATLPILLCGALLAVPATASADLGATPNITPATPGSASVRLTWDGQSTLTWSARAVGWDSRGTVCITANLYLLNRNTGVWKKVTTNQKCGTKTVETKDFTSCPDQNVYKAAQVEGDAIGPGGEDTAYKQVNF